MVGGGLSRSGRARGWRTSAVSMIPCREFDKSNLGICYPGGTMRTIATSTLITFFAAGMTCVRAVAQEGAIQDNSFLVEEAYNQEPGVVQHIAVLEVPRHGGDWSFDFTQEWPGPNLRHQLSYTVPVARVDGKGGLGDLAVNYRYQLLGDGDARLAVAPRLRVLLPTGDEDAGSGSACRCRGSPAIASLPIGPSAARGPSMPTARAPRRLIATPSSRPRGSSGSPGRRATSCCRRGGTAGKCPAPAAASTTRRASSSARAPASPRTSATCKSFAALLFRWKWAPATAPRQCFST